MKPNLYLVLAATILFGRNSSFTPPFELPANLFGLWSKPSYGNFRANKKAGRVDKTDAGSCSIVGKSHDRKTGPCNGPRKAKLIQDKN